jgi:hypothetical protein
MLPTVCADAAPARNTSASNSRLVSVDLETRIMGVSP